MTTGSVLCTTLCSSAKEGRIVGDHLLCDIYPVLVFACSWLSRCSLFIVWPFPFHHVPGLRFDCDNDADVVTFTMFVIL